MARQKDQLKAQIEREQLIEGSLPELSFRILTMARERGRIKTGDIEAITGES
jgi:hypothetical protein